MKDYERIRAFINSYNQDDEPALEAIYREAIQNEVPVVRRDTKEMLKVLLLMHKPKRILEIGAAVGYSSLYMSQYIEKEALITTIELDPERAKKARENISKMEKENVIQLYEGDAAEILPTLKGPRDENADGDGGYDFIFVDAAKGQYVYYYEEVMRLSGPGTVIASDNVLQDGTVMESHFLVEKRDRTIHDRMRKYLELLKSNPRLETAILSVGDGLAVSYVKE